METKIPDEVTPESPLYNKICYFPRIVVRGGPEGGIKIGDCLLVAKLDSGGNIDLWWMRPGGTEANVTDVASVGGIPITLFDAQSILAATADNDPDALSIAEQRLVGRLTGGNVAAIVIGIADNNIVQVDGTTNAPANLDYAKWTASGLEGKSYAQLRSDIDFVAQAISAVEGEPTLVLAGSLSIAAFKNLALVNGNILCLADGVGLILGGGGDAFLYYDGTNLRINPQLVGAGNVDIYAGNLTLTEANATVDGRDVSVDGTALDAVVAKVRFSYSITVEDPTSSEDITIAFTNRAITVTEMRAVLIGTANGQTVSWTIRHHATDRTNAGIEVVTGGTTTTSLTAGSDVTAFNDATIPADSFIWCETTAKGGTVTELHVTIIGTID